MRAGFRRSYSPARRSGGLRTLCPTNGRWCVNPTRRRETPHEYHWGISVLAVWLRVDSAVISAMARPNNIAKVPPRQYSPDDIKQRVLEAEARATADTRTAAQRWLGDPPPERSALAARLSRAPGRLIYDDPNIKPERGEPFDSDFNAPKKKLGRWVKYRQRRQVRF